MLTTSKPLGDGRCRVITERAKIGGRNALAQLSLRLALQSAGSGLGEEAAMFEFEPCRGPVGARGGLLDGDASCGVVRVNSARHQLSIQAVSSSKRGRILEQCRDSSYRSVQGRHEPTRCITTIRTGVDNASSIFR
jgi:hypothetical protein